MANCRSGVRLVAFILACAAVSVTVGAQTRDDRPSRTEVMLLPRFCWGQFLGKQFQDPRYGSAACGYFMNHYCPGLVDLNRANRTIGNEAKKRAYLLSARENTLYTLRGMNGYPNCPLRPHAQMTLRIIDDELKAFR